MTQILRELHYGNRLVRCYAKRDNALFSRFLKTLPDDRAKAAIITENAVTSYDALHAMIAGFASCFRENGLRKGDRVVIYSGNRPDYIAALYAGFATGIITIPVDARLTPAEVDFIATDSGARLVLAAPDLTAAMQTTLCRDRVLALDAVPPSPAGSLELVAIEEEDPAFIVYTSGTTGKPKGAVLTHFGIIHSCLHFWENIGLRQDDVIGVVTPITHVTGLIMGVLVALQNGSSMMLMERFKARDFLDLAARCRMNWTVMVPAMYSLCLMVDDFDKFDLSAWRIGNYGGSPMPEPTIKILAQKMPWLQLVNGYGATETSSPAIMIRPGEGVERAYSIGRPLPCVEIVVVDDKGNEVPRGHAGELWIKGPMLAREYFGDPEATSANFIDGYWRTGDVVRMDEDGYVVLMDRIKDVINRGGYKIYSAEVENVLQGLPGVVEVAVVPKQCAVLGERVHAVIYSTDTGLDLPSLQAFCTAQLADYKIPESADFRTTPLPKGPSGKIQKKELKLI
ncbi:class I adenylate-forming enzyme family protein [Aquamicrobium defluvii]|uniref:O-succinylbenzoic acid--CoA ligase n=1 Tax=Aquamicrobium defluvii TaxID=69279 RepID=A0A4R6Y9G5_9HYPH|nr:class I adenylate-forming enzyme family protein [Aquamicrobium defluvii]TDR32109.1 O-succinylbenzoic acid--CoA ligase [Aquamicrobium defluvii]